MPGQVEKFVKRQSFLRGRAARKRADNRKKNKAARASRKRNRNRS